MDDTTYIYTGKTPAGKNDAGTFAVPLTGAVTYDLTYEDGNTITDRFERPDTAAFLGQTPQGVDWYNDTNGRILNQRFVANFAGAGSVYARMDAGEIVTRQSAVISFSGTTTGLSFAFICSDGVGGDLSNQGAFRNMTHLIVAPTGMTLTTMENGVFSASLSSLAFTLPANGTPYTVNVTYDEDTSSITAEVNGNFFVVSDPSIARTMGRYVIYQILHGAASDRSAGYDSISIRTKDAVFPRLNYLPNPEAGTNLTSITTSGGAGAALSRITTATTPWGGTTAGRMVMTGTTAFQGFRMTGVVPVNSEALQASVWMKGDAGGEVLGFGRLAGTYTDATTFGSVLKSFTLTNQWKRFEVGILKPNPAKTISTLYFEVYQGSTATNPAINYEFSGGVIEPVRGGGPFFDGAFGGVWVNLATGAAGTAHASPSGYNLPLIFSANGLMTLPRPANITRNDGSVSVEYKIQDVNASRTILSFGSANTASAEWLDLSVDANDILTLTLQSGTGTQVVVPITQVPINLWQQCTVGWLGSLVYVYVNENLTHLTHAPQYEFGSNIYIGSRNGTNGLQGSIRDLLLTPRAIYDYELDDLRTTPNWDYDVLA